MNYRPVTTILESVLFLEEMRSEVAGLSPNHILGNVPVGSYREREAKKSIQLHHLIGGEETRRDALE